MTIQKLDIALEHGMRHESDLVKFILTLYQIEYHDRTATTENTIKF